MYRHTLIFAALCSFVISAASARAKSDDSARANPGLPTITVTKLDVGYKTLKLSYEIGNESGDDVWICESIDQGSSFEVYLDDDGKTLTIRKRLDVPSAVQWMTTPLGKYVRLRPGKKRNESLLLRVPVNSDRFYSRPGKDIRGIVSATRLAIKIGYYVGNLPEAYLAMSEEPDRSAMERSRVLTESLGAAVAINETQESSNRRDDEVLIFYPGFEGERVLAATIGDLSIPYTETTAQPRYSPPDLTNCTRVEVQYEPSLLEYFYPDENQRGLLNKQEIEYLQSQKSIVIESAKVISDFANELKQARQTVGGIASGKSKADVVGYDDSKRVTSFVVYNDTSVDTEQERRIKYLSELQSLRKSTRQIQPFGIPNAVCNQFEEPLVPFALLRQSRKVSNAVSQQLQA